MQFGGLARQALGLIPGGQTALSIYDMAGDPKQAKRAVRAAKKGHASKAARHAKKAANPKSGGGGSRVAGVKEILRQGAQLGGGILSQFGGGKAAVGGMLQGMGKGAAFNFGAGGHGGHRRMNVGNVKALRRSVRRVEGFAKLARKTLHLTRTVKLKSSRGRKR
jgi:hypothetical protein